MSTSSTGSLKTNTLEIKQFLQSFPKSLSPKRKLTLLKRSQPRTSFLVWIVTLACTVLFFPSDQAALWRFPNNLLHIPRPSQSFWSLSFLKSSCLLFVFLFKNHLYRRKAWIEYDTCKDPNSWNPKRHFKPRLLYFLAAAVCMPRTQETMMMRRSISQIFPSRTPQAGIKLREEENEVKRQQEILQEQEREKEQAMFSTLQGRRPMVSYRPLPQWNGLHMSKYCTVELTINQL